ncbi:MAG: 3-deoxy-7-phosphoheptulonate synthase [Armatimonadetes bacterium]|nr:3-deoxy-7-phosphoheptulonate synthase [Armatimonadota bacterium]
MVIIMQAGAPEGEIEAVIKAVETAGFRPWINPGIERKVIALLGAVDAEKAELVDHFAALPGVERVTLISEPYKLASRRTHPDSTIIQMGSVTIGGPELAIIAGPCSIENRDQMFAAAYAVKEAGANLLRGGAYKPRTSPYSFQGLGVKGLELLAEAGRAVGLPTVTEVLHPGDLEAIVEHADVIQIGARNMQNFRLLQEVGKAGKPVILKRNPGCRVQELLTASEYVMLEGNANLVLCERGITSFENATRYTLDLNAVPVIKRFSHLPVIVDPSHAAGDWHYVQSIALAAVAAGADGVMIEVHPHPAAALSDGPQSLTPARFKTLMESLSQVAEAVGRKTPCSTAAE